MLEILEIYIYCFMGGLCHLFKKSFSFNLHSYSKNITIQNLYALHFKDLHIIAITQEIRR